MRRPCHHGRRLPMHPVVPTGTVGTPIEPRISYAVARLERAVRAAIAERVRPYGLTTLQYTTLTVLHRHGAPLSNAQLARRAYMTPQAMSEVIEALEIKKLIKRNPHPTHGRLLPASLTAKGRRVLAYRTKTMARHANEQVADGLPESTHRDVLLPRGTIPCLFRKSTVSSCFSE